MRNMVAFTSEKFPPCDGEEDEINPGIWGRRLAEYLRDRFSAHGFTVPCIGPEDWVWMVAFENAAFPLWIGCGHQDGPDQRFICFIEPSKPYIRKWFTKIDTTVPVAHIKDALATILASDPDIHDIEWFE